MTNEQNCKPEFDEEYFFNMDEVVFEKIGVHLTDVQRVVFKGACQGYTYEEIAANEGYSINYLKQDVGPILWKTLSEALGEKVSKTNFQTALQRRAESASTLPKQIAITNAFQDWGETVDVPVFYGRTQELATLKQWIVDDRCRLVTLLGIGGIGKTTLSIKLAKQIQDEFEYVIWLSLRNAPSLEDTLAKLLYFLSNKQQIDTLELINTKESLLIDYLRKHRCLLILDNIDSILQVNNGASSYQKEYEKYTQTLKLIGETPHQSCLMITSREKPKQLAANEGSNLPIRSLQLLGLEEAEAQHLFELDSFSNLEKSESLIKLYRGNPLALKIIITTIQNLFDGNIANFLAQEKTIFGNIGELLKQQFERLSKTERDIMYWLAIYRQPVSFQELEDDVLSEIQILDLAEAFESLQRRSLVDKSLGLFTLQPILLEYITDCFIKQVCEEILTQNIVLLRSHILLKAQAKDYVREMQISFILKPIIDKLITVLGTKKNIELQMKQLLLMLQEQPLLKQGYTGGNILNLLCQLQTDLSSYDFSNLNIWQAYLQCINLQNVNFTYSDLAKSVFTKTFGGILSVAFSLDGKFLTTGDSNGETHLWQVTNAEQILSCKGHTNWVRAVSFSPDGQTFATSYNHAVRLCDAKTGQCLKTLHGHISRVWSVAFSPDGQTLASGSNDGTVKLWKVSTGQFLKALRGYTSCVTSLTFSSEGNALASGSNDGTVKLWEISTGQCLKILQEHTAGVKSVAFNPKDNALASGSNDGAVKLWDVSTGQCLKTLHDHTGGVQSVVFSPEGNALASGSNDQTIRLWDISTGQCLKTLHEHTSGVQSVAFSPEGQILASGSSDQTVRLWNVSTGQCLRTIRGYTDWVMSLTFSPDGKTLASGSSDQTVKLWDTTTGECLKILHGHLSRIQSVAFNPQGKTLASGSDDATVKLWDSSTGQCLKTLQGHTGQIWSVAFSPDSQTLASVSSDQTVRLWDTTTGECLKILHGHTSQVWRIAFSPQGMTLATGSEDGILKLWDVKTGQCLKTWLGHTSGIQFIAFSPHGKNLATSSDDGILKLWDVKTWQCLKTLQGHTSWRWAISFSPDGQTLASESSSCSVKLWNLKTGQCLKTLQGHASQIWTVSFSPDNQSLAYSSKDETIELWNIKTGKCLKTLRIAKPYASMNITGVTGLTDAQKSTLRALGATD